MRAYLAAGFAGAYIVAGILLTISTLNQVELLKKITADSGRRHNPDGWRRLVIEHDDRPRPVTQEELFEHDQRQRTMNTVYMATASVSFLFLLLWIYRAHGNLPALGTATPRFSPGWAVGYWFIPVLNLFRPWEAVLELAVGSDPGRVSDGREWGHRPRWNVSILVWWLGNVFGGAIGLMLVAGHAPGPTPTPEVVISLLQVVVGVILSGCGLTFLQILIILRIDRDQELRNYLMRITTAPSLSFLKNLGDST